MVDNLYSYILIGNYNILGEILNEKDEKKYIEDINGEGLDENEINNIVLSLVH